MGYLPYSSGFQRLTASGVVSDSGKPILITAFGVESGSSAALPYLKNGTAASSPAVLAMGPNTVSQGNFISISVPLMLPGGCYVSFDANTTAVTVGYILQSVTS